MTNELVTRWCIMERVKRLAGNEIELGMKIPMIESWKYRWTKGITYVVITVRLIKIFVEYWFVHFASCFYIDIYCIMGCYYTLYHNTYAFSLLFYKVYMKMENADSWNSGLEKEQILETYSTWLKSPETSRSLFLEYIKNIGRKKHKRGATNQPQGWRARPNPLGTPPTLWPP